jgi:DNA-binding NarL/FixJ family response regulator
MGRAPSRNDSRFRAILDDLEVIRPDGPSAMGDALAALREILGVEALVCAAPIQTTSGWALERFHADNLTNASRFRTLASSYLTRASDAFGWFDPFAPEPEQRNVFVDLRERVPTEQLEASRAFSEVLVPLRLHKHHIVRALICEGEALLAWLGVFHPAPLTSQQRMMLDTALPSVQRRLAVERQLATGPLINAALDAVLDHIAAPAFIVTSSGRIFDVNEAGRAILATRRAEVSHAIVAALAHEPTPLAVDLTPLDPQGAPDHWLAVIRTRTADARIAQAIARVSTKLKLTRRQRDVLARLITGETNAAIAEALRITERAVEQHVTAIFDRAAVDSRAALVTYVLLG